MERKKSYKGFVIWLVCFCLCFVAVSFLPIEDEALITRIVMNLVTLGMAAIAYMIYRNGHVYWYTGITYEEASKVSEERCKAYALKHLKLFGPYAGIYLVFSIAMHLLQVGFWVDILVCTLGLTVTAVRTMWFRL